MGNRNGSNIQGDASDLRPEPSKEGADERLTVKGWVRTRRDSKAGFSFIELNDGSCLSNLQIIADKNLVNYREEISRLQAGCSFGKVSADSILHTTISVIPTTMETGI